MPIYTLLTGTMGEASEDGEKIAVVMPKTVKTIRSGNPYIY